MNSLISQSPTSRDLDESLVHILSKRLGCSIALCNADAKIHAELIGKALASPSTAVYEEGEDVATLAIRLPAGRVALWTSPLANAAQIADHAEAVLSLEVSRAEVDQLQAETIALATQVADDFEGLALIRSLAASLEMPSERSSVRDGLVRFLAPLSNGVGAGAIAAVFVNEADELRTPVWSHESVISDRAIYSIVQTHRDETNVRTVVRNDRSQNPELVAAKLLNEFIMVECRSEGRLHGWLIACNRVDHVETDVPWAQLGFSTIQASLLETASNQLAGQLHNMQLLKQKEELFTDVVRALVNAVEARDPYTYGHSERVAQFARCLAMFNGESTAECERIYLTGLLHDVGKIAIPDGVLQKPGSLDDDERAIIETHTDAGWRILHELDALKDVLPGVLYHHERFDGKGYPDGLVGENIPLDGRILAVCDSFDAMTSDRPYRNGMSIEDATDILQGGSGTYWDPNLIELFIKNIDKINEVRQQHRPRKQSSRPTPINGQPTIAGASNPASAREPSPSEALSSPTAPSN